MHQPGDDRRKDSASTTPRQPHERRTSDAAPALPEEDTRVGVEKPVDNPIPLDDAPAAPLTSPDETKGG
jgi:hypothetical protein